MFTFAATNAWKGLTIFVATAGSNFRIVCVIFFFFFPFFNLHFTTLSRELYFPSPFFFHFSLHICLKRLYTMYLFFFEKLYAHAWIHSSERVWITQSPAYPEKSLHVDSFFFFFSYLLIRYYTYFLLISSDLCSCLCFTYLHW